MTLGARCLASRFSAPAPMMSSSSSSERPSLTPATRQSTASETSRRHAPSRGALIRRGSSAPSVTMTPPIQGCPALWQADAACATTSRASEPSCAFPAASMPMGVPGRVASLAAVLSGRVASLADALPSCSAAHNVVTASGAPVVQYAAQITTSQPVRLSASKVAGKRWPPSRRTRTNRGATAAVPFCRADMRVYAASASAKSSSNNAAGLGLGFGSSPECCGPLPSPPRRDPQSWSRRRGSMPSPSSISPTRSPAASRAPFVSAVTIRPPPAR